MSFLISADFLRPVRRSCAAIVFAMVCTASAVVPAHAEEVQTPASKQQVDTLIQRWQKQFDGADTLAQRRSAFNALMASAPGPTRVQIRHVDANGADADLVWPARLHHPLGRRALLYIHGGGFYSGSSQTHRAIAGSLAKSTSADVLVVNYRLVPEYAYPSQINDVLNAYRWLLESGYSNDNIVFAGDSVGGTIAIEAVLRQMRRKKPLPAAVIAMSPVTDLAASRTPGDDPVTAKMDFETIRKAYLDGASPTDPEVSPAYADMTGFPPLLMQVGSREIVRDETLQLAKKAKEAGVDVTAQVWPGMIHQWQLFPFWLDDADRSNQQAALFAIKHFADKPRD
jgi:acetyl esterase/lipase